MEKARAVGHNFGRTMSPLHGYRTRIETADTDSLRVLGQSVPSYGPCLHLGSHGERCERPALEGGFCARHDPDAAAAGPWTWFRRLAALLVLAAILWPIVQDLLAQLSRRKH